MSNLRRPTSTSYYLDQLTGRQLPGGCDDCHAYQTVIKQDGIYVLTVHHDDTCPFYTARTA